MNAASHVRWAVEIGVPVVRPTWNNQLVIQGDNLFSRISVNLFVQLTTFENQIGVITFRKLFLILANIQNRAFIFHFYFHNGIY